MMRPVHRPPWIAFTFALLLLAVQPAFPAASAEVPEAGINSEPAADEGEIAQANDAFPNTSALEPQVSFWIKIYSVYTTSQAVVHDSEHLDIIYGVESGIPDPKAPGAGKLRKDWFEKTNKRYTAALERLAEGPAEAELSEFERALKVVWGETGTPTLFKEAAERLRLQVGQADRFREGVQRSGSYLPRMGQIIAEFDLPEELLALPHVESSFDPTALSHRRASGIWQWTRGTGRQFMRIDRTLDERRDPFLATRAAAECLGQYHEEFNSWPVAITAYNHGIQGMRRAVSRHGTDIVKIIDEYDGRSFKFASRNFYAEFLAALEVSQNYREYFGELEFEPPIVFDEVTLTSALSLREAAEVAGVTADSLAAMNPAFLSRVIDGKRNIPAGYALRVPDGQGPAVTSQLATAADSKLPATTLMASADGAVEYRVQWGDTLSHIAARFGTDVSALLSLNKLDSHRIYAGQKLLVPTAPSITSTDS
jgi:membrane-bound lytic murein transglycosylase D